MTRASVVIPAHDEAAVIDRTLDALRADPAWDDLEVVVVCNGCKDDTAAARRAHGARVVETEVASKAVALDLGDRTATAFPRLYLDADVAVGPGAVTALLDCLEASGAPAASLRVRFDAPGASRLARWYLRVLVGEPALRVGPPRRRPLRPVCVGAGPVRDGSPTDAVSDDLFVMRRFAPAERATADGWFVRWPRPRSATSCGFAAASCGPAGRSPGRWRRASWSPSNRSRTDAGGSCSSLVARRGGRRSPRSWR